MEVLPEHKCARASNQSSGLQLGGDAVRGETGPQHHERLCRGRYGHHESPAKPSCGTEQSDNKKPDDFAHGTHSLDDGM